MHYVGDRMLKLNYDARMIVMMLQLKKTCYDANNKEFETFFIF